MKALTIGHRARQDTTLDPVSMNIVGPEIFPRLQRPPGSHFRRLPARHAEISNMNEKSWR
jgi:hypothetical protein